MFSDFFITPPLLTTRETGPDAKGTPLTNAEVDNNFIQLQEKIVELQTATIANSYYVKKNGNNDNSGKSWTTAFATIERALEEVVNESATDGETDEFLDPLTLIEIGPGIYETEGHLDMPDNTMIVAKHRTVVFVPKPGFEQRNVFRMGSGCFIEGMIFEGWELDDYENPTEGFAVCFRPGALIRRTPYAHKIAVRTVPYWNVVAPPLDRDGDPPNPEVGRGCGVVLADGSQVSQYSVFPNIMTWGATPVSHNGIGYCAKKGGLINAVNAVSLWAHRHFYALDGGQIILSSCSTQFGDFTMVSKGSRDIVAPFETDVPLIADQDAADAIENARDSIIASILPFLDNTNDPQTGLPYSNNFTDQDREFTERDTGTILKALRWVVLTGNEKPMIDTARGFFDVEGQPVFSQDKKASFLASYEYIKNEVLSLGAITSANTITLIQSLMDNLRDTVDDPQFTREPSLITAIGHTWTGVMAGVALTKIPPARNQTTIEESILELEDGVVIASGQDDQGNAIFVGGLVINADTGELSGPPFDNSVNRIATRAAIARSF